MRSRIGTLAVLLVVVAGIAVGGAGGTRGAQEATPGAGTAVAGLVEIACPDPGRPIGQYEIAPLVGGSSGDATRLDLNRMTLEANPPGVDVERYAEPIALTVDCGAIRVSVEGIEDGGEVAIDVRASRTITREGGDEPCDGACILRAGDVVTLQAGDAVFFRDATYGFEAVGGIAEVIYAIVRPNSGDAGGGGDSPATPACQPCPRYP